MSIFDRYRDRKLASLHRRIVALKRRLNVRKQQLQHSQRETGDAQRMLGEAIKSRDAMEAATRSLNDFLSKDAYWWQIDADRGARRYRIVLDFAPELMAFGLMEEGMRDRFIDRLCLQLTREIRRSRFPAEDSSLERKRELMRRQGWMQP